MTQGKWTKQQIVDNVLASDQWAVRALMAVYRNQTESEQESETTVVKNGVGFTGYDAEILTSFAKCYERRRFLTPKQMAVLRKRIVRYWKQLLVAANDRQEAVAA